MGVERFCRLLLEAAGPYAAAVKPNLAFFEAFGSAGMAALERIRASVPAGVPVVADAKRGDIGSTARRQAVAIFDHLGADAVTASPYVGAEGLAPFLERADRYTYVLCRTSNPGSDELQGLVVGDGRGDPPPGAPPASRSTSGWPGGSLAWGPGGTVGLVVGATAPRELARVRALAPGLGFLVPGVGAQGGEVDPVLAAGPATGAPAAGPAGRGTARQRLAGDRPGCAWRPGGRNGRAPRDPGERLAEAARNWSTTLAVPVLS